MSQEEITIQQVDTIYTLEIYDRHTRETIDPNGMPSIEIIDPEYKKFEYTFDFTIKRIKDFQATALFVDKDNVVRAVRVEFTDGSYVNCTGSHKDFLERIYPDYLKKVEDREQYVYIKQAINDLYAEEEYIRMKNRNNDVPQE